MSVSLVNVWVGETADVNPLPLLSTQPPSGFNLVKSLVVTADACSFKGDGGGQGEVGTVS
jgi:hypothetical protein